VSTLMLALIGAGDPLCGPLPLPVLSDLVNRHSLYASPRQFAFLRVFVSSCEPNYRCIFV